MLGFFAYDRFISQPKETTAFSKSMLVQIEEKEGWVNSGVALNMPSNAISSLTRHIDTAFVDGNTIRVVDSVECKSDKESF